MKIEIISAKSPRWLNAEHTEIELLVTFAHCGEVPFTASPLDTEEHGRYLFAHAAAGEYGEVASYVAPVVPPPTPEQIQKIVTDATQKRLDTFARTRNYDNILSACTYATSSVTKFRAEGQLCVDKRDLTWAKLYEIMAEVEVGTRPMPTSFADIEGELPELVWLS